MISYIFDGSYPGFLTAVFESFERKEWLAIPVATIDYKPAFFDTSRVIVTDMEKAKRVYMGLQKKLNKQQVHDFFRAFLSEDATSWKATFYIILQVFRTGITILQNYGDGQVLHFAQTLKKVSRERHRMKAFIRFEKSTDGLFYALIEPDFNVLPLVVNFFRKRYASQHWLIYDIKRNYGMLYDEIQIIEVQLTTAERSGLSTRSTLLTVDEQEEKCQRLWRQYFKSTNIEARRNMKLHLQHVPRRYWKYLTEKKS